MIFNDSINLNKKQFIKIQKWFNSARKYGFTYLATARSDLTVKIRHNTMIDIKAV